MTETKTPSNKQPPISRFPVPNLQELPDDLKAMMLSVQEKAGFIPNVFLSLAWRPDELRAFMAYHDALMERNSGLSKAEREMIVVATSAENRCGYCVIAHGIIAKPISASDKKPCWHLRSKLPRLPMQWTTLTMQICASMDSLTMTFGTSPLSPRFLQ